MFLNQFNPYQSTFAQSDSELCGEFPRTRSSSAKTNTNVTKKLIVLRHKNYQTIINLNTLGKAVTRVLAANGVQNKFESIMFSSKTLCSFNTAIAFITVFPVPTEREIDRDGKQFVKIKYYQKIDQLISSIKASGNFVFELCLFKQGKGSF